MSPYVVALACFSVVMSVMALLVGVLYAFQAVSRRQAAAAAAATAVAAPEAGITPELVAVLAAAAHAALGKAVVIRRINVRPAGQENWSRVGRIDILRSHRMDPKR